MLFLQECCKRQQSVTGKRPLLTLNARNRQSDAASCAASSRVWPARTLRVLVQHRRHHPAAAEVTQLLHGALLATPTPRCPPSRPVYTRAGSRHWQPGGLLKKRLDSSAKAMEYKPQKPDPALAGAQAHAPGRQRPSWPLFREPPNALAPKATHGPRPPPLRTTGAASASSSVAAGHPAPGQATAFHLRRSSSTATKSR